MNTKILFSVFVIAINVFSVLAQDSMDETIVIKGIPLKLIYVQGGTFMMGGTSEQKGATDKEKPVHKVTLSDYRITETEITQELWQAVMGDNPSCEQRDTDPDYFMLYAANSFYDIRNSQISIIEEFQGIKGKDTSKYPVNCISYNDCQIFIKKLNEITGQHFSLPTEAQWEYAARGGRKSNSTLFSGSNKLEKVAFKNSYPAYLYPVKSLIPNELGIYDMTGNVMEICLDSHGEYSSNLQTNPLYQDNSNYIVLRGGIQLGANSSDIDMRISNRMGFPYFCKSNIIGFRLTL